MRHRREASGEEGALTAERQRSTEREALAGRGRVAAQSKTARVAAEADRLKLENDAQRAANQAELRTKLLKQFNGIFQTRDSARGLIVNMSDILFDTAKFTLSPEARDKLAKVAGIVSAYPGLRLDVEGHTDNVGGDECNQNLSEQRGTADLTEI